MRRMCTSTVPLSGSDGPPYPAECPSTETPAGIGARPMQRRTAGAIARRAAVRPKDSPLSPKARVVVALEACAPARPAAVVARRSAPIRATL